MNNDHAVFSPQSVAAVTVESIKYREANKWRMVGLPLPAGINEYFAPVGTGQIAVVLAQTSNYKSGLMRIWIRGLAQQLIEQDRDEIIVSVSFEESIEEQAYHDLAAIAPNLTASDMSNGIVRDWVEVENAATRLAEIPVFRIGDSIVKPQQLEKPLLLTDVFNSIRALKDGEITGREEKISAIFVDYLQVLPYDDMYKKNYKDYDTSMRMQTLHNIRRLRRASFFFDCPVIIAVQARQSLKYAINGTDIPGMFDGQESAFIGQHADRIVSMWLPKTTRTVGGTIEFDGLPIQVTEDMMLFRVVKQRGNYPAGKVWLLRVKYNRNMLEPYVGNAEF